MVFELKLIRAEPIEELSGWAVFELMGNARHLAGDYWIYEGDVEAFKFSAVKCCGIAVGDIYGDMSHDELLEYASLIFGFNDLKLEAPAWRMLKQGKGIG